MRSIPVDTTRLTFLASGKVVAKPEYAELADGQRRRVPGAQAKNDQGLPLWVVDCFVDDDEAERAEVVGVVVASMTAPAPAKFQPVLFTNLLAKGWMRDGRVAYSFTAEGIADAARKAA